MESFDAEPDPDHPGWTTWNLRERGRFNDLLGRMITRTDPDGKGRLRMLTPGREHTNLLDTIHGGALMAFIDIALFAGARACGVPNVAGAQTIDCSIQFIGAGRPDRPLDAVVELLRETGRMAFLRGMLEQEGTTVAAFSGTIKKGRG